MCFRSWYGMDELWVQQPHPKLASSSFPGGKCDLVKIYRWKRDLRGMSASSSRSLRGVLVGGLQHALLQLSATGASYSIHGPYRLCSLHPSEMSIRSCLISCCCLGFIAETPATARRHRPLHDICPKRNRRVEARPPELRYCCILVSTARQAQGSSADRGEAMAPLVPCAGFGSRTLPLFGFMLSPRCQAIRSRLRRDPSRCGQANKWKARTDEVRGE